MEPHRLKSVPLRVFDFAVPPQTLKLVPLDAGYTNPTCYFLFFAPDFFAARSSITACAAARRAIGTRNGEALT
jgi:hypothetical protein